MVPFICTKHALHPLRDINGEWWILRKPKYSLSYWIHILKTTEQYEGRKKHVHQKLSVNQLATTDSQNQLTRTKHKNSHMFNIRRTAMKQQSCYMVLCSGNEAFETKEQIYCSQFKIHWGWITRWKATYPWNFSRDDITNILVCSRSLCTRSGFPFVECWKHLVFVICESVNFVNDLL